MAKVFRFQGFNRYEGFNKPNSTQVPNDVFDILAPHLSEAELRVLLYIIRRTFGFQKNSDYISLNQLVSGIKTRDGRVLDVGTGMSRSAVWRGVKGLLDKHIIRVEKRVTDDGDNQTNSYSLCFLGDGDNEGGGVVLQKNHPSSPKEPGVVLQKNPQNIDIQNKDLQYRNISKSNALNNSPLANPVILSPTVPKQEHQVSQKQGSGLTGYKLNVPTAKGGSEKDGTPSGVEIPPGAGSENSPTQQTDVHHRTLAKSAALENSVLRNTGSQGFATLKSLLPLPHLSEPPTHAKQISGKPIPEVAEAISDISQQLANIHHVRANISQAMHIYTAVQLRTSVAGYVSKLFELKSVTLHQEGVKNLMAYFFTLVRREYSLGEICGQVHYCTSALCEPGKAGEAGPPLSEKSTQHTISAQVQESS